MKKYACYILVVTCLILLAVLLVDKGTFRTYSEPENAVINFYNWYLKDVYLKKHVESPTLALNDHGVYQLDSKLNFPLLKSTNLFSKEFFENNQKMYDLCNLELAKADPKEVMDFAYLWAVTAPIDKGKCSFMNYMIWTGGQGESINSFKILDSNSVEFSNDKKNASVLIRLYVGKSPYSYVSVGLVFENNKWLINNIDVYFYDAIGGWREVKKSK